ncbi:MAG: hypothetical protein ACRBN8_42135 [Nannocystales bacterium]
MHALALVLVSAFLAPTTAKDPESVRILSIELSADGVGGAIRTEAIRLADRDREFRFGEGACRKHTLADRVLAQLFDAMQTQREVVFETERVGESDCVRRVRFSGPRA